MAKSNIGHAASRKTSQDAPACGAQAANLTPIKPAPARYAKADIAAISMAQLRKQYQARGYNAKESRYLAALSKSHTLAVNREYPNTIPDLRTQQMIAALPTAEAQAQAYAAWRDNALTAAALAQVDKDNAAATRYAERTLPALESSHYTIHAKASQRGVTGGYLVDSESVGTSYQPIKTAKTPGRTVTQVGVIYSNNRQRVIGTKNKLNPLEKNEKKLDSNGEKEQSTSTGSVTPTNVKIRRQHHV